MGAFVILIFTAALLSFLCVIDLTKILNPSSSSWNRVQYSEWAWVRDGHILINSPTRLLTTIRTILQIYIIFQPNKSFLSALAVVSFFLEITLFLLDGHKNIINYCTRHFLIFWKVSNGPLNEGMTLYFPTKQSANLSSLSKFIFIFFFEGHSPLECLFLCHCL